MRKVAFVAGLDKRVPMPQSYTEGPSERVMRLNFQIQDLPALIPTVVTRDKSLTAEPVRVPRQAFLVAPLLNIMTSGPLTRGQSSAATKAADRPGGSAGGRLPPPPPHVDAAGLTLQGHAPGYKDRNQDAALLLDTFLSNRQQLLAVMDGHGPEGHRVSAFVRQNLPYTLLQQLLDDDEAATAAAGGGGAARDGAGGGVGSMALPRTPVPPDAASAASAAVDRGGAGAPAAGGGGGVGPVQRAMWRAVTSLDEQLADSGIDVINSGTTAAMCHVHGRKLTAAWVGDSRVMLGLPARGWGSHGQEQRPPPPQPAPSSSSPSSSSSQDGGSSSSPTAQAGPSRVSAGAGAAPPVQRVGGSGGGNGGNGGGWWVAWSSEDHKPELPQEAARIEAAGGRVARSLGPQGPVGPYRVWLKHEPFPGLAMSRALGDLPGRDIGITCTPSLASLQLPDHGPAVLVLASDGVWELLGNEQVLQMAAGAGSATEAASRVVQQARRAWVKEYGGSYVDDITALVLRIDMPPKAQQRQREE